MKILKPYQFFFVFEILYFSLAGDLYADNILLDYNHGGDGSAWGLSACESCHLVNLIHEKTQPDLRHIVQEKGYASCTACHGSNGTQEKRVCILCHNNHDLTYASRQAGNFSHNFQADAISEVSTHHLSDEQCVACHNASDMNGIFDINVDLSRFQQSNHSNRSAVYKNTSEFCLACHNREAQPTGFEISSDDYRDPLIAMADNYRFIDKHGLVSGSGERTYAGLRDGYQYADILECTECHAMHGSNNRQLIISNAYHGAWRLSAQFKQHNISIQTDDDNYAQLCVLCHAMDVLVEQGDLATGNGLSGVHQARGSCKSCHRHGMAVQTGL